MSKAARKLSAATEVYDVLRLTYVSPEVEKRTSPIDGRGLYARSAISKGEIATVKGGYTLTKARRDEIGKELGPSEIQIAEELFIGPSTMPEREGAMMHLNHSCEPNVGVQGQIVFVALRDIASGEELTLDYAMIDDDALSEMQCRCGAKNCRGTITGLIGSDRKFRRNMMAIFRGSFSVE